MEFEMKGEIPQGAEIVGLRLWFGRLKFVQTAMVCSNCGYTVKQSPCEFCGGNKYHIYGELKMEE
jgi:hypothetical protein